MATCRDIITKAYRRIGIVAAGSQPSSALAQDGLDALKSQYTAWVAQGVFGRFRDYRLTASAYTALEQDRISVAENNSATVSLPDSITQEWVPCEGAFAGDYGFVARGAGGYIQTVTERPPRDMSCVLVTTLCDCVTKIFVYDGAKARWQEITALELNDEAPLSTRFAKGLADTLAGNLADSYGQEAAPKLVADILAFNSTLSHKWDRPRVPTIGSYF
jgi:hypothetical protein